MSAFFTTHFEGIIAIIISIIIPSFIVVFQQWEKNIKNDITKEINGLGHRLDDEVTNLKEKTIILKEQIKQLEKKEISDLETIKNQLEEIERDIIRFEEIKTELTGTREMLLIQNKALNQQFTDFKEFIATFINTYK